MIRSGRWTYLMLALAVLLGGCGDSTGAGTGTLSLLLTDAPGDVLEAWVTIDRIYLQPDEDGEAGQVDVMTQDVTVDLMTLAEDLEGLVEDAEVATGQYAQLRVVVTGACIVVEGEPDAGSEVHATSGYDACGEATDVLQAPSLGTGVQVLLPEGGLRVSGGHHILLLDFDVSESFRQPAGLSGQWVMEPVIRGIDFGLTSALHVQLSAADGVELPTDDEGNPLTLGDFVADLSTEASDAAFRDDDGDGVFTARFDYLVADPAQTPVVSVVPPDVAGYSFVLDPESESVTLVDGWVTVVEFVLTAVEQD